MIRLIMENMQKKYGQKEVLNNISLSAGSGEVVGLIGTNGAGKTTLLKMIAGLSRADGGTLCLSAEHEQQSRVSRNRRIALVPQENNLERECTVFEVLYLHARLFGVKDAKGRVAKILHTFGMQNWQGKKIEHLSGGMARRVLIARALLAEPEIILLDEPSVGLDPDVRQEIWQMISAMRGLGKTIVLTTHYMDEAESLCDTIALLKEGRLLYTGTIASFKERVRAAGEKISMEAAFLAFVRAEGGI